MVKTVNIRVRGKVQGVYYRVSTVSCAEHLDIAGWVENKNDGSVLIHAQGAEESIQRLIEWAWQGPERAKVDTIDIEEFSAQQYVGFEVRY